MKQPNDLSGSTTSVLRDTNEDWGMTRNSNNKVPKNEVQIKVGQTPCRFYQLGQCSKGSKCSFMHKKAPHFAQTQCKFFVNGFCRNGDRCPFSHQSSPLHPRKSNSDLKTDPLTKISPDLKLKQKKQEPKNSPKPGFVVVNNQNKPNGILYSGGEDPPDDEDTPSPYGFPVTNENLDFFFMDEVSPYTPDTPQNSSPYYDVYSDPSGVLYQSMEEGHVEETPHRTGSLGHPPPLWNHLLSPDIWGSPSPPPRDNSQPHPRGSHSLPESGIWGVESSYFTYHGLASSSNNTGLASSLNTPKSSFPSPPSLSKTLFTMPINVDDNKSMLLPLQSNLKTLPISIPNKSDRSNFQDTLEGSYTSSRTGSSYKYQDVKHHTNNNTNSISPIYTPFPLHGSYPPYPLIHGSPAGQPSTVYMPSEEDQDELDELEFDEMIYAFQASIFEPENLVPYIPGYSGNGAEVTGENLSELDFHGMSTNGNFFPADPASGEVEEDLEIIPSPLNSGKNKNKKKKTPKKGKMEKKNSPDNQSSSCQEQCVCSFYQSGDCRYGLTCRNIHLAYNTSITAERNGDCYEKKQIQEEIEQSKFYKCERCKQNVLDNNKRFGLLTECIHCFCLQCIKDWRSETQKSECPICNVVSHFVVPSNVMVIDKTSKNCIIQNYKEKMKQIPCKYFDGGKGTCKFGANCHYAHVMLPTAAAGGGGSVGVVTLPAAAGELTPVSPLSPRMLLSESNGSLDKNARTLTDAQGDAVPINTLNLGMFLTTTTNKKELNKRDRDKK